MITPLAKACLDRKRVYKRTAAILEKWKRSMDSLGIETDFHPFVCVWLSPVS